jgi:hypothetical protein
MLSLKTVVRFQLDRGNKIALLEQAAVSETGAMFRLLMPQPHAAFPDTHQSY